MSDQIRKNRGNRQTTNKRVGAAARQAKGDTRRHAPRSARNAQSARTACPSGQASWKGCQRTSSPPQEDRCLQADKVRIRVSAGCPKQPAHFYIKKI